MQHQSNKEETKQFPSAVELLSLTMAQYFQSEIYSSLWSGHRAHSNSLSDPSFCTRCRGAVHGEHACPSHAVSPATTVPPRQGSPQLARGDVVWGQQGLTLCLLGLC